VDVIGQSDNTWTNNRVSRHDQDSGDLRAPRGAVIPFAELAIIIWINLYAQCPSWDVRTSKLRQWSDYSFINYYKINNRWAEIFRISI
jgi:hypothetical protein